MCLLQAQTSSTITIGSNPVGARIMVDSVVYNGTVTLNWPSGSQHVVSFVTDACPVQTSQDGSTQFALDAWVDNKGDLVPAQTCQLTVTADPSITSLIANVAISYRVYLNLFGSAVGSAPTPPPACAAPGAIPPGQLAVGIVYVSTSCYYSSGTLYIQENQSVRLNAFPYPGFVFMGWAINGAAPTAFLTSLTITGPTNIAAMFVPGKEVQFLTSPPGLKLLIDHTTEPTRSGSDPTTCPLNETQPVDPAFGFPAVCFGDFYFAPLSSHFITGVSPQMDNSGKWWVFNNWANGQAANSLYTVPANSPSDTVMTANFVRGAQVALLTSPNGLPLNVDGRSNWGSYNFIWGQGTTHQVSAPSTGTDAKGRVYNFKSWSNGGDASQTVTVDQNTVSGGMRMTASYSVLSRIVVQTVPAGMTVQVDGTACTTPCNVDRQSGAQVQVSVPTQVPMGQGARMDFGNWSDGGASTHAVTVSQDYTTLTATYNTAYQLSATSNPGNGASFQFSPSSSDMFYAPNTLVSVTVSPNDGFKFLKWGGQLTGTYPSGVVNMSGPVSVVAQMSAVPYIAPAGIANAVGVTPSSAVAPGSLISIFGQSLAPAVQLGPANPLSQSIGGVSVTVNNMILPLMFVSPQQINAQLPSSLADGSYTLVVHNTGQPDVTGPLTVARNAPGLFFQTINTQQIALAFHTDGSLVTPDKPAAAAETITVLGTGFGPYGGTVVDGFYPPNPPPAVADSVTVNLGGQTIVPQSVTAAPGYTGMTLTAFQVPSGLASGTPATLKVTINGNDSNPVLLPLQ